MREEYHVTLYSQMGPREGRLVLQYEGSAVTGSLELMGRRNPVHGVRSSDVYKRQMGICASLMLSGRRSAPFSARRRWSSMGNALLE